MGTYELLNAVSTACDLHTSKKNQSRWRRKSSHIADVAGGVPSPCRLCIVTGRQSSETPCECEMTSTRFGEKRQTTTSLAPCGWKKLQLDFHTAARSDSSTTSCAVPVSAQ